MNAADEICRLDASELALRIREKQLSPVEVLDAHEERIAALNPGLNAIVTPNAQARSEALNAERSVMRGDELGRLHGVPFTAKDSFDTAGLRTARGSLLFADNTPAGDATTIERLRSAGGILLGKTNIPEFVLWVETDNRISGPTCNPWDLTRTPGGSSGGEGAAIATGMSPLGLGSDLAGSIRLPAHYCGIFGFKPTHGRVPLTGHWPQTLQRFTHAGPMARSIRDIRLALEVLEGGDGHDWFADRVSVNGRPTRSLDSLRVGWIAGTSFGPLHPDVAKAVDSAAAALAHVVHSVAAVSIPQLSDCDYDLLTMQLFGAEGAPYFEQITKNRTDQLSDILRDRLAAAPATLAEYVAAESVVEKLRQNLMSYFQEFDILLCPTSPTTAPTRGQPHVEIDGQQRRGRSVLRATVPFDLAGVPAVSVPCAVSGRGLPIGIQVIGSWGQDHEVLDVADALMQAMTGAGIAALAPIAANRNGLDDA